MARTPRRLLSLAAVGMLVTAVAAQQACILAQGSGDVPRLPAARPTIVHPSVVPSTSTVLTRFPAVFIVPVELVDPTAPFVYAKFVDYNPATGEGRVDDVIHSAYQASNTSDRTRVLEITIPEPSDLDRCHVIEVVVALSITSLDPKGRHTPDPPGGDLVTWFYNPNGDLGGCPSLDAGVELRPDGGAGEGGAQ